MKFLIFISALFLTACVTGPKKDYHKDWQQVPDQMYVRLANCDSASAVKDLQICLLQDSLALIKKQVAQKTMGSPALIDSLKTNLFLANYKIEKVKYYLKICYKNPSQDKFLKGWVTRAVN